MRVDGADRQEVARLWGRTIEEWHAYLVSENGVPQPHLCTAGSTYGEYTDEAASWALAVMAIWDAQAGEPDDTELFADNVMSMVVNDDLCIGRLIATNRHLLPKQLLSSLDFGLLHWIPDR